MKKECKFVKMFNIQIEIDCTPEKCPFGCSIANKRIKPSRIQASKNM